MENQIIEENEFIDKEDYGLDIMDKKVIDEQTFEITSNGIVFVLARGIKRMYSLNTIIKNNKNKNIMLWQNSPDYYPCKRFQLNMQIDLQFLLKELKDDFDILIIDALSERNNSKENIEFFEHIKNNPDYADKTFIIYISPKLPDDATDSSVSFAKLDVYKDTIRQTTPHIYTINKTNDYRRYILQDKYGKTLTTFCEQGGILYADNPAKQEN